MSRKKNEKRSDGRLQSKVYLGKDKDGKKLYKYVYAATNKELQEKVNEIKMKLGKGIDVTAERDTFDYWRENWLKIKKSNASAKWYETCEIYARKLDEIAYLPITKIRAMDLQNILIDMVSEKNSNGRPYSERTLKITRDIANGIMNLACENRVIEYNPFAGVKLPKAQKEPEQRRALTREEQNWIIETPHRAQTAAMIMMFAGLRRGELMALQWTDIDLNAKTINVNKSVSMVKGNPMVKVGGKSDAATRTVYIPDILADYLREQTHTGFLVCPSANGKLMSQSAWRKLWKSYLLDLNVKYGDFAHCVDYQKRHKTDNKPENERHRPSSKFDPEEIPFLIPNITAHWLRHTFITNMYFAGVDILTAKQQAGHSDIKITMEIYTHLDNEYKVKNIEKLNTYLSEGCHMGVSDKAKMA